MKLKELLHITENVVNDLTTKIDKQEIDHKTLEEEILKHINKIGNLKELFIADGAHHNWEIQMNNFFDAVCILDFYHATEHLSDFCDLFIGKKKGKKNMIFGILCYMKEKFYRLLRK